MKLRNRSSTLTKVGIPIAPMIAVIFLLLIFFMLNLKIVSTDANFKFNLYKLHSKNLPYHH